jgi:polyisoprenyl-teichoic acid--peptidoglycan teichoic acid transferase
MGCTVTPMNELFAEASDVAPEADPGSRSPASRPRRSDRHGGGRRTRDRRRRRRQALGRIGLALATVVSVALAVVWAATTFDLSFGGTDGGEAEAAPTATPAPGQDPQPAYVFATFDEADPSAGADLVMILAHEVATGEATVVLVASGVVADIPGHGLLPLRQAYTFGAGPLLELSVDNLLGTDLDGAVGLSRQGWSALFSRVGGLTIDVPGQLVQTAPDGTRSVRFQPGEQFLDGPRLAEYLTFRETDETELQRFPRVQRVLEALFDHLASDPAHLEAVFADGAPMLGTNDPDGLRALFADIADARVAGRLQVRTLPVTPVGSGDDAAYRIVADRAEALVTERLAPSRPTGATATGRRLQILNGNGIPGIGQQVAERLQPAGFRVVLTRNADRFDHQTTRIIVFDDAPEQLAAAQEIRDLLGVGQVEISEVPQAVADITIIVGQDFTG